MNKRISDEELNVMKLLHPMKGKKYDVTVSSVDLLDLCNDLQDAREALKRYEPQKPSLAEHLQKLANKHKVCFRSEQNEEIVFYIEYCETANAEYFFNVNRAKFYDDLKYGDAIKPEVTDE